MLSVSAPAKGEKRRFRQYKDFTRNQISVGILENVIIHVRPGLALFLSKFIGYMVNGKVITRNEVEGLMSNLLVSGNPPTGKTLLSDWLSQNAGIVGTCYASELARLFFYSWAGI